MSLVILFHFLCAQHISDINISIIRSLRLFCWITTLIVLFLFRCVLEFQCGWFGVVSACNTDTTPTQPHRNSNTHRNKNNTINVVIQQNSRKLLMMDILMSETCWAHKNCNKIASDIKLVFYSSTIQFSIKCTMGNVQNFNVFISDVPSEPCRTVFTICTLHHMLSASSNQGTWDVGSVWKKWERREIPTGFALEFWMSETTRKTKA